MSGQIINSDGSDENILSLPIKNKDLGSFISNLLGQQQSIEKEIDAYFDIDHDWLLNLHQLLSQRIHMQANANLIQFVSVVYFNDGLKRKFTTVEAFENYSETKKNLPIGIKIIWTYLIKFPHKDIPEKQQITFSAKIHRYGDKDVSKEKDDEVYFDRSVIQYQIDHTERTWGDDIETLISNKVDEAIRVESKYDKTYNFSRFILLFIIVAFGLNYLLSYLSSKSIERVQKSIETYQENFEGKYPSSELLSSKIDYIVRIVSESDQLKEPNLWGLIVFFIVVIVLFTLVMTFLEITKKSLHSFLVLSKSAEKYRQTVLIKENRRNIIIIMSYVLSIVAGIIANYGYNYLINQ